MLRSPDKTKLRVGIVHRRLAHYRLPLYEKILETAPDIELTVFCGKETDESEGSGADLRHSLPNYIRFCPIHAFSIGGTRLFYLSTILRNAASGGFDVIIFEGAANLISNFPALTARRLRRTKNVLWLKGWPRAGHGTVATLTRRLLLALAHSYIGYGQETRRQLVRYGIHDGRISVAQNTVEVGKLLGADAVHPISSDLSPATTHWPKGSDFDQKFALTAGRLVARKRITDLLDAWKINQDLDQWRNLELLIVGRGPDRERLERHVAARNIARIQFFGALPDADLEALFLRAEFCVFPGSVGLALNQAMAAGRPVVCADEPGPDSELLIHGKNGLRFVVGRVTDLAEKMKWILSNDRESKSLGVEARNTISEFATIDRMAQSLVSAIRSVLGQ